METVKDSWTSLNGFGSKGFESLVQLGEINLRTHVFQINTFSGSNRHVISKKN